MSTDLNETVSKSLEVILEGFLESGEIKKAKAIAGLLEDPESKDSYRWFLLGRHAEADGDMEKAKIYMENSIELGGHGVGIFFQMSRVLFALGEYDQAIDWITKAVRAEPGFTEGYFHLARVYASIDDFDKAVDVIIDNILVSDDVPNEIKPEAHAQIGRIFMRANRHCEALHKFEEALSLSGDEGSLWADLGHCQSVLGDLTCAQESFSKAVNIDPSPHNLYNLGDCLLALDETDEAVKYLERALRLSPDHVMVNYDLGLAYYMKQMYKKGVAASRRALGSDPRMELQRSNPGLGATTNLGMCLMNMGFFEEAMACFDRNITMISSNYFNKGLALIRMHRPDDAAACFKKILEINPDDVEAMNLLGQSLDDTGKHEEAISVLKEALEHDPNYALGYYDLSVILAKRESGRDEAMRCCEKYLSLEHDNDQGIAWALYSIACLHATAGRGEEALNFFEQSLEKGLRERDHIDKDKDLDQLRHDPRFTEIMRKYFSAF